MLDASGNQNLFIFPAQKNARGRKDREFHSNLYTLWKLWIQV